MYDLVFPNEAIEVVRDLYKDTLTSIHTPHGQTDSIMLDRGTIQGDSLSPFLVFLHIEPLLRWLKAEQTGYKVGALAPNGMNIQEANRVSDITFADDINISTNSRQGTINQTEKVTGYADWGFLQINNTKAAITAALHRSQPTVCNHLMMHYRNTSSGVSGYRDNPSHIIPQENHSGTWACF